MPGELSCGRWILVWQHLGGFLTRCVWNFAKAMILWWRRAIFQSDELSVTLERRGSIVQWVPCSHYAQCRTKMYKMLWAETEALYIVHIVQIVQIVQKIFTECAKNVKSGVGGPGKQKDWSFRQQGGKERTCKQNISHFSSPRSPLILRLKMCKYV